MQQQSVYLGLDFLQMVLICDYITYLCSIDGFGEEEVLSYLLMLRQLVQPNSPFNP